MNQTKQTVEQLQKAIQEKELAIFQKHLENGVIFKNFDGVHIDEQVTIGAETIIDSNTILRGNTTIGTSCILQGNNIIQNATIGKGVKITSSVLTDCEIGSFCTVGPNAHVHTNSKIQKNCRIGNFVEIKNSELGISTKAAHLAYIGDTDIGNACNIGCGTIFVNYDGKNKHRSYIGDSVFIGSNSNIIAPVRIQDNAFIAAGTTVTVNLPKNCMCIGRSFETIKPERSTYRKNDYEKKYFGTDGIRGIYGVAITTDMAYLCGNFLGYSSDCGNIVVGRDNRPSGKPLLDALINGITDAGSNAIVLDFASTPNVAYSTQQTKSNYGIVITASHNSHEYNGIKIFNYDGRKLTNIEEIEIEKHITNAKPFIASTRGEVKNGEYLVDEYIQDLCNQIDSLDGFKIVLDCSNGVTSYKAAELFKKLNCTVHAYNTLTDGYSINDNCGALYPKNMIEKIKEHKADLGLCFDGDGDRVIALDGNGNIVNGDSIIYVIAKHLKQQNKLNNDTVVGTLHTNLGAEISLKKLGIALKRTDVGDHFVMEEMLKNDYLVGGEQSGHIILREFSNTGDGILAGLELAKIIKQTNTSLDKLNDCVHYPQINIDIRTENKAIVSDAKLINYVDDIKEILGDNGRVMVRASGTEPKVRVMVEAMDKNVANEYADKLHKFITSNYKL